MSEVNVVEGDQMLVPAELAELMQNQSLNQIQYDNLCRFMIYFSLAESKLKSMASGISGTSGLAKELVACKGFDAAVIDDSYLYFIDRYRDNENAQGRFERLNPSDFVSEKRLAEFNELRVKTKPTQEDKIDFVFKVIFRLRHNLFHGEKWSYNLEGQHNNFSHAAIVLLSCLTLSRGSMW